MSELSSSVLAGCPKEEIKAQVLDQSLLNNDVQNILTDCFTEDSFAVIWLFTLRSAISLILDNYQVLK